MCTHAPYESALHAFVNRAEQFRSQRIVLERQLRFVTSGSVAMPKVRRACGVSRASTVHSNTCINARERGSNASKWPPVSRNSGDTYFRAGDDLVLYIVAPSTIFYKLMSG